jgi:hypothetical protein
MILCSAFQIVALAETKDDITTKDVELAEFHTIYLNSGYTVYLKQTNKQEVKVEVLSEIYERTELKVENGVLHINTKPAESSSSKNFLSKVVNPTMNIYISMRRVNELMVNGGGMIKAENSINSNNLKLAINGSGSMNMDIKGMQVRSMLTGSGDLTLKGYADNYHVEIGGSGNVKALNFEVLKSEIKLSGDGRCEVHATDNADVTIYGAGTVAVKGAKNLTQKIYGKGKIERSY